MRRHNSILSYQIAQQARFAKVGKHINSLLADIAQSTAEDLRELTAGSGVSGRARKNALKRAGHPYGRGSGSKKRGVRAGRGFANRSFPNLPIGKVSGRLHQGGFASLNRPAQTITAGFSKRSGRGIFAVMPGGTARVVDRGFWRANEGGEMGKRFKAKRVAMYLHLGLPLRRP